MNCYRMNLKIIRNDELNYWTVKSILQKYICQITVRIFCQKIRFSLCLWFRSQMMFIIRTQSSTFIQTTANNRWIIFKSNHHAFIYFFFRNLKLFLFLRPIWMKTIIKTSGTIQNFSFFFHWKYADREREHRNIF